MNQKKRNMYRFSVFVLALTLMNAAQFRLVRPAEAQGPNGIGLPALDLRALGIDNQARQITSLLGTHVTFFKRAADHRTKGGLTPREARELQTEGDQRKNDIPSIKRELESLINKLKQGNHWDAAFDAQFAAALKNDSTRSLLNQAGGARKLFEAAVGDVNSLRDDIDDELRHVSAGNRVPVTRNDRSFAAHAGPPAGKVCTLLLTAILFCTIEPCQNTRCLLVKRYNEKGCIPGPAVDPNCG